MTAEHASTSPPLSSDSIPLRHLRALTGEYGVFEHAEFTRPRLEHGLCVDDNARVLVVLSRLSNAKHDLISSRALRTVVEGFHPDGWRNRRSTNGRWGPVGSEDAHGRALWGLSCHLANAPADAGASEVVTAGFARRLGSPRAIAFGVLGAVEIVGDPMTGPAARGFLDRARTLSGLRSDANWRWPESRLAYANARWPEALIALGTALEDESHVQAGLDMLEWLISREFRDDRFSFTPMSGRGPYDSSPAFDQQPIEAWAMLDACRRATAATKSSWWSDMAEAARAWFFGLNDRDVSMLDASTGAGFDGLTLEGRNANCGAESTLAALAALIDLRVHG